MSASTTRMTALSPAKRQLFEQLLREKGITAPKRPVIPRCSRAGPLPLSAAQQRMWFLEQMALGEPAYSDCYAIRFAGDLEVAFLERALQEIVRRHEVLRTTFASSGGQPGQIIHPDLILNLPVLDLQQHAETDVETQLQRLAVEAAQEPFDLAQGPLLRTKLLRMAAETHVLILVIHHLISDGQSLQVLFRELAALYEAFRCGQPSPLPEVEVQYADFAAWEQQRLTSGVLQPLVAYWKQQLAGPLPALELPTDFPRPAVQTYRGTGLDWPISTPLADALAELSRQEDVTLFMTLLAAFQSLLAYSTGADDIRVGSPVAIRTRPETEGQIGLFVNTLVLRTDLSGDPTFRSLLGRTRETCLGAYAHQELPLEAVVKEMRLERDLSRNPLFQVLILQHALPPPVQLPALRMEHLAVGYAVARFDLAVWLVEAAADSALSHATGHPGELVVRFQYNTDLFHARTIARLLRHFEVILRHVATHPDIRLSALGEILSHVGRKEQIVQQQSRKLTGSHMLKNTRRQPVARSTPE